MAVRLATYDPAEAQLIVSGNQITGFAPGTMFEYEPDAPVFLDGEGVDGETARWLRRSPYGTVRATLSFASPDNQFLNGLLTLDRVLQLSVLPLVIQDPQSLLIAPSAWISSQPAIVYNGDSPATKIWEIRTLGMIHDVRGLPETSVLTGTLS